MIKTNNIQLKTLISNKKNNKQFITDIVFTMLVFFVMIIIIINPKKYTSGTIQGLKLFFYSVLPGLFPFMILTKIMTEIGIVEKIFSKFDKFSLKLFGTTGISLYVLFMSIISGYPIGAKIISDLYNKKIISEKDAKKMSLFCTTSGPIFIIGTIGTSMFSSYKIGVTIYFSHILSSILLGIIFNFFSKTKETNNKKIISINCEKHKSIISNAISETINSLFIVGAYITIFFLIGEVLDYLKIFSLLENIIIKLFKLLKIDTKYIKGIIYGILEVTRGAKTLSVFSENISVIFVTGILSFSGLSIIFQSMAFLRQAKIKTRTFIFYKFVHSLFSMFLCCIILLISSI